ncbi:M56 family metallopeptidase [Chryseobacterium carnipullorum]|uniref:M56 family metallopeptidase n=1 Tax=Chryseobacterium carnipullorum TaxID=1124835 RepID=A0A376EQX4_CHRCU|nr:M56 family metallopeptidase [Chryseobacterium carnipullorum]AZA47978.1 M56 family metallopeptidase [Chryseobacterium carnipullorum]STD13180.1 Regulatory protein BlaR1 [Chryseobacterium carnipullorum]
MLIIILKIILCSSIFIAVYYLFLEREKMYRFNRFYLLCSLILSYVIPFISITVKLPEHEQKSQILFEETVQQITFAQHEQESFNWVSIVWLVYGAITVFLLIKSILSFRAIKKMQGEKRIYQNHRILVIKENIPPFSFWNTIYLGKTYVKDDGIDTRIFLHEKGHIDQKHSLDLIFLDIFKIFTWFNPVLFFYKKAILTNHEFLADEAVLNNRYNIKEYQNLILKEIIHHQNLPLTHSFNFNNTKKRFIMMTAKKSKFIVLKKAAGITAMIAATALFAERTYAVSPGLTEDTQKANSTEKEKPLIKDASERTITAGNVQANQSHLTSPYYFEKSVEEKPPTTAEIKKEMVQAVSDTVSPGKTASNEGINTNDAQKDQNFVEAEFPEGAKSLRSKVGSMLDTSIFDGKERLVKSTAFIHIDETGKVVNVTASGDNEGFNKEMIKTVTAVNSGVAWKPATKNGKAIASIYKMPATMSFK